MPLAKRVLEPSSCVQRGERSVGPLSSVEGRGLRARLGTSWGRARGVRARGGALLERAEQQDKDVSALCQPTCSSESNVVIILGTLSGELVFISPACIRRRDEGQQGLQGLPWRHYNDAQSHVERVDPVGEGGPGWRKSIYS